MARLEAPVMNTRRRAPAASASSTAYWISGLSTIGSISLGMALVAGRKRVPDPATGNTALRTRGGIRERSSCAPALAQPLLQQLLADFDAPLIEGVDVPQDALHERALLVEGKQSADRMRRQLRQFDESTRPIAGCLGVDRFCFATPQHAVAEGERIGLRHRV